MARVLIVEDDPGQLEMRKLILEQAGYEVLTAQSAAEALDRLPGCQVVLMDLQLPTPEEGLRLIEAAKGRARIIVLSGGAQDSDLPVDEFLTKPCSSKKLLETVARFCVLLLICLCSLRAATFTVVKQGEVTAELEMRAPGTDWATPGHEAKLITVLVDGNAQQQV
ncbi:MAG TPA: response regulator, partial [Bryobacteraceae bacterium]|nr:response regulator [Bryobacteraceae bacterium]